jgi:hypothetical protein
LLALAAVLAVALVLGGVALIRNRAALVTGGLSSTTVQAGDVVVVSAHNLPANQSGLIRLLTPNRDLGAFQANRKGDIEQGVMIPRDEPPGDHVVQVCWSAGCHDIATVHVAR